MMTTVPHVTSGLGLRKFQADGFLLTRVYQESLPCAHGLHCALQQLPLASHYSTVAGRGEYTCIGTRKKKD